MFTSRSFVFGLFLGADHFPCPIKCLPGKIWNYITSHFLSLLSSIDDKNGIDWSDALLVGSFHFAFCSRIVSTFIFVESSTLKILENWIFSQHAIYDTNQSYHIFSTQSTRRHSQQAFSHWFYISFVLGLRQLTPLKWISWNNRRIDFSPKSTANWLNRSQLRQRRRAYSRVFSHVIHTFTQYIYSAWRPRFAGYIKSIHFPGRHTASTLIPKRRERKNTQFDLFSVANQTYDTDWKSKARVSKRERAK